MSDDEPYDADGDVGRFLHCPSPEAHLFPLSEPEGTLGGLFQNAPTTEQVQGNPAPPTLPAPDLGVQGPANEVQGQPAPDPGLQLPATEIQGYGHPAPQTQNAAADFGLQAPTTIYPDPEHYEAPIIDDAEHYDEAPIIDAEHHQTPVMDHQVAGMDVEQYQAMAMDVQPTHMVAPEMQQGYGFITDPTLMKGDNGVDAEHNEAPMILAAAEHYQAPTINAEDHQVQAMDVEPQYQAMAMDDVQPATHVLAGPEPQQAYGAFPEPWLAGESMYPPPSPSLLEKLQELAAMLDDIEAGGSGGAGGGAEADAPDAALCPAEEDVAFRPIVRGQLDCSRCRTVREVVTLNGPSKVHFMVHSAHPGTFQHGIVDRMYMGADGNFRTYVLLHHDLRGRMHEWVMNFIAMSVEKMKRHGVPVLQDTCALSDGAGACSDDTDDNHAHMDVEVDMPDNLPSATADDQAPTPEAAHQPSIPEGAPPAVMQAQENTDAPSIAEAATAPEAASAEAAHQPSVTQAQEHADAPSEAAADQPPASQAERNAGAGESFPPFNWEGFQPEILESSHVEPYDPASGVNVLMYPSMQEQLRQDELRKKEGKKLSKMAVTDTPDYLNMNDDHCANAPNFSSAPFKRLCEKDPTYRLYKRRISGLIRKIRKLEQSATKVGTGGLFKIKQKMESFKHEKEELYDMIKRAMQENERRNGNGAGPSNLVAGPSNGAAGPSSNVAGSWNNDAGPSDVAAAASNEDAGGPSNVAAGSSNTDAGPSNVAGPSGTE
ncbi:hypothetical protein GQ55_3G073100 [Panicum hallii var. hallii]|uniref:Uncharacterized protein n=1 Tax=Panicum hallii var. hallii TaxID=1504633 RepID=A0A2T7E6R5_9POAL|nr:hypothetical protein GQ55_3G073100 [Panicum hallii var. hallii]